MQPGLSRAVPVSMLAFIGSLVFVMVVRYLQDVTPLFDPGVGMILAAFVSSFAFIWGMGGADPRMSTHPHEPEVDAETGLIVYGEEDEHHEKVAEEDGDPISVLGYSIWQVSFLTIVVLSLIAGFALAPTGFTLQTTNDPDANVSSIGDEAWEIPLIGVETELSQLAAFSMVIIFTFVLLFIIGGGIGLMMTSLNQGVKEVGEVEQTQQPDKSERLEAAQTASGFGIGDYVKFGGLALVLFGLLDGLLIGTPVPDPEWLRVGLSLFFAVSFAAYFTLKPLLVRTVGERVINIVLFLGITGGLYTAFYYVLIGLAIPSPEGLRWWLSVINAVAFAAIIVYPTPIIHATGRFAGSAAKALRGLPEGLGQK